MNNPDPVSTATRPRGAVFANGERIQGLVSFEVDNNTFYQADTFRVTLCLSDQPPNRGFAWWAEQREIEMEMMLGLPADPNSFQRETLQSLLIGNVDDIEIDPIADEILLGGRDLTARFIDTKTVEKYQNQTASEVAIKLAKAHGLTPVVTVTQGTVGTYYQIDHAATQDDRPEWDVLTYLAQVSGFVVYVKGRELHFKPKPDPAKVEPYVLRWQPPTQDQRAPVFNGSRLRFSRNLTVARDIKVSVRSYNQKQKRGFTKTAERKRIKNKTASKVGRSGLPPQQYSFFYPNMTPDEAQKKANQLLKDISEHEVNLSADVEGDTSLNQGTVLKVEGTATAFDQLYFPASVVHSFDFDSGYRTLMRAKNSSPESTVQA